MEYEVFEPDQDDEYYDQACAVAYARMFNGRSGYNAGRVDPDNLRSVSSAPDCGYGTVHDSAIRMKGA